MPAQAFDTYLRDGVHRRVAFKVKSLVSAPTPSDPIRVEWRVSDLSEGRLRIRSPLARTV
jgi:hypothetical protein